MQDWHLAGQTSNSASLCLISRHSLELPLLPALLTATHFFDWFYTWSTALLGKYAMTLASLICWVLQHNLGFTFTAWCNGLSRPTCSDIPEWLLASAAFLSYRCATPQPFLVALTFKPDLLLKFLSSTAWLGLTLVLSYITFLFVMVSLTG